MTWSMFLLFVGFVGSMGISLAQGAERAEPLGAVDFNRDVRPILSDNCYFCHGPDKNKRKADLRLDTQAGLFAQIENRSTVVPGRPLESELFRRITAADPAQRMPDPKSNKRLSDHDIAVMKAWIEQGAPWKGHWAYLPIERPPVPGTGSKRAAAIDAFIAARLTDAGLTAAAPADRSALIRRASFDLTGLPPTPAEVKEFQEDSSPDAYEKIVDRLLASPHFGERMAVFWLDIVRYADSIGYHSDNPMNVYPYRDYVIRSFNSNKPFDQFTIEQLAGDLLPNATQEQKVASAYNRLLQTTEEGGAQPKEYEAKYAADRVRNVSTTWMASTMGCCQCHDHKFDPFTAKDFYSMAAFFADVQEPSVGKREPGMPVPDAQQSEEIQTLDAAIASANAKFSASTPEIIAAEARWESLLAQEADWQVLEADLAKVTGESRLRKEPFGVLRDYEKAAAQETFTVIAHTDLRSITGFRLEALEDETLPAHGPGTAPNGNFVLTEFKVASIHDDQKPAPLKIARAAADFSQDTFPIENTLDGKDATGWAILPLVGKRHTAIFELDAPIGDDSGTVLVFTLQFRSRFPQHNLGKFRLSATTVPGPAGRMAPATIRQLLAVAPDDRTPAQRNRVWDYFRSVSPVLKTVRGEIAAAETRKAEFLKTVPLCLVTTGGPPRTVRLLNRGNWMDDTGPAMTPAVPAFLANPSIVEQAGHRRLTRLDLANWMVSRDNPLTARVLANRLWKLYFGQGLSKVLDDLGSQGEWPTHPELLDWLAAELMNPSSGPSATHDWDVKHVARLIVTSNTYRESSKPSELDKEKDPYNRLLAHQARFRLDAEFVRDNALAISGLLVDRIGGASAKPYEPPGYWDQLNFPPRQYVADHGENQYRRGLYTWWQRSFPHPSSVAFDAPSREEASCERNRSNIPQQALVLLNDPTYVEAARVFATRIMQQGGNEFQEQLTFAYESALARPPRSEEVRVLRDLFERHLKDYHNVPSAAEKLIHAGEAPIPERIDAAELAAWTSVARTLLNLHETITRM